MSRRILHISTRLILGGSQENTVLSCEGQAALGHEVHLAFGPIYGPEGSLLERVREFRTADGRGIACHEVPALERAIHPWKDAACLRQLRRLIEALEPDVVHTHSSKAGILGRFAAWWVLLGGRVKPGVVHTIHGPPFMPVEGSMLARMKTRLMNDAYAVAERAAAERCHVIVSVADAMTETFLARGIGRRGRFVTVRSGMEFGAYLRTASGDETREAVRRMLGIGEQEYVIGTVARLAAHKGHDDVLDALGEELKARPAWRLLWVGDGYWRERLVGRLRSMGLEDRVVLTGLVAPERVPPLMRAMDLLVHPSYREGLPRTVVQALLAGTPVVASDADGTREVVRDTKTGRLVPVGDSGALREAVCWMADRREEARATAEAGRRLCADWFDARVMVEALEGVYERAIEEARRG